MPDLSVQKASILALVAFLQGRSELAGWTVQDWWPADDKLENRTISIIPAGAREDLHSMSEPRVVAQTVISPTITEYTYRIMACAQPIQVDVWANDYEATRAEMLAVLDRVLTLGLAETLGSSYANRDPFRDGLLLALDPANGHAGHVDAHFQGPQETDTPDAARRREWRATIRGELRTSLQLKAQSTRILRVILAMRLGETPLGTAPEVVYTFDSTS